MELPKLTGINNHVIDLIESQQTLYGPTYSLGPVELKTLKTYVETNLASGFIRSFKSQRRTSGSPRPCQMLCFIQLDLTDAYHVLSSIKPCTFRATLIKTLPRSLTSLCDNLRSYTEGSGQHHGDMSFLSR